MTTRIPPGIPYEQMLAYQVDRDIEDMLVDNAPDLLRLFPGPPDRSVLVLDETRLGDAPDLSAKPLPNGWWTDEDNLFPFLIPDTMGLPDEPGASRERVAEVVLAEVREMHRRNGLIVATPSPETPRFADAIRLAVEKHNQLDGVSRIGILDADRGRVVAGVEATLRLFVPVDVCEPNTEASTVSAARELTAKLSQPFIQEPVGGFSIGGTVRRLGSSAKT